MLTAVLLATALASPPALSISGLSAAISSRPAWQASFEQEYVPAGFDEGSKASGTILLAAPALLRFSYAGADHRVFALDGSVARTVDEAAGTCDAVRLDPEAWRRVPLAALLDPAAAEHAFVQGVDGDTLVLRPRTATVDLAEIRVAMGADGMPAAITVVDGSGNRNTFTFSGWRAMAPPPASAFAPSLPGAPPCEPGDGRG